VRPPTPQEVMNELDNIAATLEDEAKRQEASARTIECDRMRSLARRTDELRRQIKEGTTA